MARTKHLTGKTPLNPAQQHRAETFRLLLLDHHGLKGKDKDVFERIVNNLSQHQLTNISRQYRRALESWYDSNGVSTIIAQDLLNRIRQLGRATLSNAVKEIQTGGTKLGANVARLAKQNNLGDIEREEIIKKLGYRPGKWGK